VGQKKLACYQETGNRRHDGDMFVDLTIHDVPACLLKEFGEKVVAPAYPSGVNETIKGML
jgi:hypothetical protein